MCAYVVGKVKDCDFIFKRQITLIYRVIYIYKVHRVLIEAYMKSYLSLKVLIYTVAACTDQSIVKIQKRAYASPRRYRYIHN
jgi:hypothetical protein